MDASLRDKIKSERHRYDFKVIKTKVLKSEGEDGIYKTQDDILNQLRMPQNQNNADKLLNFYHSHQFSFGPDALFDVFRRIARAIPLDSRFGGKDYACTSRY